MKPQHAWRSVSEAPPPMCDWDGDFIVYNPLSGDTHILDIVAGKVLNLLVAGTNREAEIQSRVAAFLDLPNDALLAENVGRILANLDEIGLIERVEEC